MSIQKAIEYVKQCIEEYSEFEDKSFMIEHYNGNWAVSFMIFGDTGLAVVDSNLFIGDRLAAKMMFDALFSHFTTTDAQFFVGKRNET